LAAAGESNLAADSPAPGGDGYLRLALILRSLLSEQAVGAVLARIASDLRELVRCDDVVVWELIEDRELVPALVDGEDEVEMKALRIEVGEGITGTAVLEGQLVVSNNAHADPRAGQVPGTAMAPEAIACVPLIARGSSLGALSLYRRGPARAFLSGEVELIRHFADVAAIALDNAKTVAELERLAGTDDLTGLANRRSFHEALRRYAAVAHRHDVPLSLLLLDIDNFKEINDTHGHERGDEALRSFAAALSGRVRGSDLVARIGGDEFAILLPQTNSDEAASLARELVAHLRLPGAIAISLDVSIGVATCAGSSCGGLLSEADRQLYVEKGMRRLSQRKTLAIASPGRAILARLRARLRISEAPGPPAPATIESRGMRLAGIEPATSRSGGARSIP
jgi:diguanylate cyclase (GGDEF)-like protein